MIVDSSIAVKWLVIEDDADRALELIEEGGLVSIDLIASEIANAIWKKWRRGEISVVPDGLGSVMKIFDVIEPSPPLLERATALAIELEHPAYDCFYIALAEKTEQRLVTADLKLVRKLTETPYAKLVVALGAER